MRKLFVLLLVLGVASTASAIDRTWDSGGGTDVSWSNPLNWSGDTLPVMGTSLLDGSLVKFYKTTGVAIGTLSGTGNAFQVKVAGPNPPVAGSWSTLTIANGATLNVGEYLMVGIDSTVARSGQVDMTGGTVNLGLVNASSGHLFLGHSIAGTTGYLNMSGGTINVTGNFLLARVAGTAAYANLSGDATINTANFQMNPTGLGTAMLDISENAKLIINGDVSGTIATYKDNGWINEDVQVSLTMNPGKTTLFVVPEPATVCLLGLGAMSLLRRRK